LNGKSLTDFGTDKNRALLAFLALESESPHRREALASLFWPDDPELSARNSLRQALFHLRRVIGSETDNEPHLLITPGQVQFNLACDYWIDAVEFKNRISACLSHHPSGLGLCDCCLESVQHAIDLYHGDLLAGFTLSRCTQFTDWQVINQEFFHQKALAALSLMADYFEVNLEYSQLIASTQREIELEPWRETAYRRQMWALAITGQRERALLQYRILQEVLQRELDVVPTDGTTRLCEQIRDGSLPCPQPRQDVSSFSTTAAHPTPSAGGAVFAGRQSELAKLDCFLKESLACRGRVAFVSGETGMGKTALLLEFARQAMIAHHELLVVSGSCCSYSGLGDPYQPFREILESMAGISSMADDGVTPSPEFARRLNLARTVFLKILLEVGPGLIVSLLSVQDLLQQAREIIGLDAAVVARLENLAIELCSGQRSSNGLESRAVRASSQASFVLPLDFFDQVTRLMRAISLNFPVLILLDDLQWLDPPSASLLFHLGRHLSDRRILLLGAYRTEDLVFTQGQERHPLVEILHEFQRRFGEIQVNLDLSDGRAFVDAYLDSQPNTYDPEFREMLYWYTHGNALSTVELFQSIQANGEVVKDNTGGWTQGPHINWEPLPARVEAILNEQLSRLDEDSLTLLKAASLQGDVFNTGDLARALGLSDDQILFRLRGPLCSQHLLTNLLRPKKKNGNPMVQFRFRSILLQKYLCQSVDAGELLELHRPLPEGKLV
jgi:DNA-binding SARP family transcriptional activator